MLIVFAGEAKVDVSKPCPDTVLVPFEGFQVDGVGEVRGEQLVALVLESLAVLGQLGQFLGAGGKPFIEEVRGSNPLSSTISDVLEHLTSVEAGVGVRAANGSASLIVALSSSLISMPLVSAWFASRLP